MTDFADLLRKYNVPGPRYTSYPTVPYWKDNPTDSAWIESIHRSLLEAQKKGVGAAIYVHIPFCQSLCTYCGCNTRITRNTSVGAPYVETVLKELALYRKRLATLGFKTKIPLTELHLGGGTPTFLSPSELERLVGGLLENVEPTVDREFSVEADPRVTTQKHLEALAKLGFRRLSLGIQDFDPKVQEIVHRVQSEAQVAETTEAARALGFESVNYDLIYGLPFQTMASVENTIQTVQKLRPDRIAFYSYAHVPWIKASQRRFTEADLPSGEQKRELYERGRQMLEAVGYQEIGMDHFALKGDSLWRAVEEKTLHRNFMGYTSRFVEPLIGLGVSAIGDSWRVFAQNEKLLETYQARVEKGEIPLLRGHVLDHEDEVMRAHILNLMTRMQTEWQTAESYVPYLETIPDRLVELERDGLVELGKRSCRITEKGRAFLRNTCMAFDARLSQSAPATQLFSKTI